MESALRTRIPLVAYRWLSNAGNDVAVDLKHSSLQFDIRQTLRKGLQTERSEVQWR